MQKIEQTINLSSPSLNYRVTFFNLNGERMLDAVTDDKDAATYVTDCLNHTQGSKLRAAVRVEAKSVNTLVNPVPL